MQDSSNTEIPKQAEEIDIDNSMNVQTRADVYENASVRVEKAQYSVNDLQRLCEVRKTMRIDPEFQRNNVWKKKQNSELIESILMGIPLPLIYLFENADGIRDVVDGRQRITAILDFLNNKFKLTGLKILSKYNDCYFSGENGLPLKLQSIFEDFQLTCYVIQPPTPERIKYDIFDRVNRGGTPLNNQEMRHALYKGHATELIKELANSEEFKNATGGGISSKRMRDEYVALRVVAFTLYLKERILGKPFTYAGDIDDFLATVMTRINAGQVVDLDLTMDEILASLTRWYGLLGENAFRFASSENYRRPINMPLFECLVYMFTLDEFNEENLYMSYDMWQDFKDDLDLGGNFNGNIDSVKCVEFRFETVWGNLNNYVI